MSISSPHPASPNEIASSIYIIKKTAEIKKNQPFLYY
jgi:hypothetical protein